MAVLDLMERPLLRNGFEKVLIMDALSSSEYATARILYGDIRQYRRGPHFLQMPPRWLPLIDHVLAIMGILDALRQEKIPRVGPFYENVALFYPKPDSSAKEIMVHYQISYHGFKRDSYGHFTMSGEPLDRTPDGENKSFAKEIYEAVFDSNSSANFPTK